jgi:glycosyltransferase involved in cell wall biosynthesis
MTMKRFLEILVFLIVLPFFALAYIAVALLTRRDKSKKPRLVWGPEPLINNQYWSVALKHGGYNSVTLMNYFHSSIHNRSVFDKYTFSLFPLLGRYYQSSFAAEKIIMLLRPYVSFIYALSRFDIFHHHFICGFLYPTPLARLEAFLIKAAGCRVVITPYGADFYRYSLIMDPSLRHALLLSYPDAAREEQKIQSRLSYWVRNADALGGGMIIDGLGRWDVLPCNILSIDTSAWTPRDSYSMNDGSNGPVRIIHAPNHKGFKGTEFIVQAVKELREEGLLIDFMLIERMQNSELKKLMGEVDILAEQIIYTGYTLNAIEGMATGLPVLANLENENYTKTFRRYSYLNECPVLSTSPETIKENLRQLIINPLLRQELGKAGRQFIEKYHSEQTARYIFGSIYDKIWHGKNVDLLNLFHPLKSAYNSSAPFVSHPLKNNRLPGSYLTAPQHV